MQRLVLNGSPRGTQSNSRTIIGWLLEGMAKAGASEPPVLDLAHTRDNTQHRAAFLEADEVVLVMPLYTDSVPGIVMHFIDSLAEAPRERLAGKRMAFVIQSGFPESAHSRPVATWLERLCARLGMVHCGTAIRGNSEGLRLMPAGMTAKARELFVALGRSLAAQGIFDAAAVARLAGRGRLGMAARLVMGALRPTGLLNLYWIMMLRQHGAWKRRFDQPYAAALVR